ncbi:MAG: hypothetical protein IJ783_07340 [Kiritimatiellae bacterium]|nr:hypothetical protein [Kiritimatiellia bacterium]
MQTTADFRFFAAAAAAAFSLLSQAAGAESPARPDAGSEVSALLAALPPAAADDGGETIAFTFDHVGIHAFAQIVGRFTGRKIVVADDVDGAVSVVSPAVTRAEAWPRFAAVLESSGYTLVRDGDVERVVRLPERDPSGMGAVVDDSSDLPEHGLVSCVLHLQHVSAADMKDLLEGQLRRKGAVSVLPETNDMVVSDTASAIRRLKSLVDALDKPGTARSTEVIPLANADAASVARQLAASFAESQSRAQQLLGRIPAPNGAPSALPSMRPPTMVPVEHANRILVSGSERQLRTVRELVAKLDVPAPAGRSGLHVLQLDYLKAADVSKNLTSLLEKFAAGNADPSLARRVAVEAVESANALLVHAQPADFDEVAALVAALDVPPRQVNISVLIAEVSEGDLDRLGVQISALRTPDRVGGTGAGAATRFSDETATGSGLLSSFANGLYGEGLAFGIAHGSHLDANGHVVADYPAIFDVDAIKQDSRVKIVANPSLGAQNHTKAEVAIVDDIPLTESNITGTGDNRDVIQNITRRDVGVKLSLVPHIVPGGMVQIELEPSIEAVTSNAGNGSDYAPTISKRSAKTVATVADGQTIVIAGLTRSDTTDVRRKIPVLGDIPLLGWLFRWTSEQTTRTSLLIFVTPRVLPAGEESSAAADAIRADLEAASGLSRDELLRGLSREPDPAAAPEG